MTYRLTLLVACLAAWGCDSSAPPVGDPPVVDPPGDRYPTEVVGRWDSAFMVEAAEITSTVAQTYVSSVSRGPSTVTIDGGRLVLGHAERAGPFGDEVEAVNVATYPVDSAPPDGEARASLSVRQRPTRYTASLTVTEPDGDSQSYYASRDGVVLTRDAGTMRLDAFELVSQGRVVTIDGGRAELEAVQLQPDVPTTVTLIRYQQFDTDTGDPWVSFTFAQGGVWRSSDIVPTDPGQTQSGTWSVTDDVLSIRVTNLDDREHVASYGVQVAGSRLSLTQKLTACSDVPCLERRAAALGLDGALTAHQSLRVFEWERAAAGAP